jgi:hypothetical protein
MPEAALRVLAFNCSLKSASDEEASSTDVLLTQLLDALNKEGARGDIVRAVDCNIKPGVKSDEGAGDAWPRIASARGRCGYSRHRNPDLAWAAVQCRQACPGAHGCVPG